MKTIIVFCLMFVLLLSSVYSCKSCVLPFNVLAGSYVTVDNFFAKMVKSYINATVLPTLSSSYGYLFGYSNSTNAGNTITFEVNMNNLIRNSDTNCIIDYELDVDTLSLSAYNVSGGLLNSSIGFTLN